MPTFYIVPPRKTQLGEFGISISGIFGIKTNLPNNAPITSAGALQLDQGFAPTWTGQHVFNNIVTFNDNVIFNGDQSFNINSLYIAGQTAGDLIYFNGTTWTRQGISTTSGAVLQSTGTSITWSNALNVGTTTTNTLNIGSLNGVLKASSGLVSGSSGLNDLQDVQLSSPSNNQFLKYNAGLSKWQNANVPLPDRTLIIRFLNGSTPVTLGADQEIATVPYEPSDGVSVLIFLVTRITLQIENTASSGDSTIRVQRVNANTAFPDPTDPAAVFIAELTVPAGDTEVFINRTDPSFDVSVSSGQRLRLVIDEIGTGAENWTVQLEGSAVSLYEQPSGVVPISMGGTGRSTIGAANTVLTVGQDADKLIYKQLVAGTSISIVSAPILSGGVEVGGTITVSYTGLAGGGGAGTVNSGNAGELTYYASTGTTVSGVSNLLWNNVGKKLSITAVPSTWDTSAISLLVGTSTFANGSANGTVIAVNVPSTPVFTGNFIDFQLNNSSKFSIDYTGAVSASTISLTSASASTSTTTGALVVPGGVGIGGALNLGTALSVSNGGTGVTTATSGQLLIGNTSGTFTKSTLTGSNGISITNGDGSITISNDRLNSLNGLTTTSQTFATSTSGTDFTITSSTSTHTFALPDASTTARGVISTTAQTIGGLKTFNNGAKSQEFITGLSGYFGGDPTVFTVGGTTSSVLFGIMKDDSLSRFAGIKVEEKVSPTLGSGYLYGDIVFYTDSEAEDFSTERMRIDGAGTISLEGDVSINGTLSLNNVPLAPSYGGTGNTSYTDGQLLIGNSSTGSLSKSTLTAGTNVTITNGNGTITISASTGGTSGGTVTSVGMSVPSIFVLSTSSISTSGTFAITLETTSANYVFAGPTTGSATTPAFRALVASDIPSLSYAPLTTGTSILSGNGSGGFSSVTIGTGLSFSTGTLSNSAPDQTVSLSTGNANVTITGTYPNFTISTQNTTYTNGTGINLSGTTLAIDNTVVVTLSDNQILTNKTLTSPVINSATLNTTTIGSSGLIITGTTSGTSALIASASPSGNTLTFPTSTGTLAITSDIEDGTLTLAVSGDGLSGSASFSANTSSNITFTVNSNATSSNSTSTIVFRDSSGNFSAGTITASLDGNATNVTGIVAVANGGTGTSDTNQAIINLGATTTGASLFKITPPGSTTFIRVKSDNTADLLDATNFRTAIGAGTGNGTVTNVGLSVPSILNSSTSSITSSGTFTLTLASQDANTVFAGPTTGSATTPVFRSLVAADIPSLSSLYAPVTSGTSILSGNGSGGFSSVTIGTGLGFSTTGTLSNTSPDQVVSLTAGNANVTISGTYPSFSITTVNTTYTNGTGLTLTGTSFSINNTVVTLTGNQTLTNKTLTSPTINSPTINTSTINTSTINTSTIGSSGLRFSGTSSGTTLLIASATPSSNTLTLPTATDTIAVSGDIKNGTLTLAVSGNGLSGSASFSANTSSNVTFTVDSNATSSNSTSTIVFRDSSGNFSANTITANLTGDVSGNASNVTGIVAIANGGTGASTATTAIINLGATTTGASLFTVSSPGAIRFIKIKADNTVELLDDTNFRTAIGAGTGNGTVTSVGLTVPNILNVSTSSISTSGTFAITLASQTANYVFAGPTTGASTTPTFRALVSSDIPALNYAPQTTGTSILYGNGSGGFSNATIGTGLSFSAGEISNSAPDQTVSLSTGNANVTITGTYPNFTISTDNTTYTDGTGIILTGTSFAIDTTVVATLNDTQILTNKTITGTSNTLTVRLTNDVTGTLPIANGGTGTVDGSITGTGALTFTATGTSSNITLVPGSSAFVDVSSKKIINLANPDNDQDAATKGYVDSVSQGLIVKDSVRVASTANLSGTYSNGTNGVGATLTNNGSQSALSIDNVSLAYLDRVLVKDQSTQLQNGIYYIASTSHIGSATTNWVLTRTTDADEDSEVTSGLFVFVTSGDTNSATGWVMSSSGAIDVGTSSIVFSQFSGSTTYTDSDPITINGTVISLNNGNPLPVNHGGTGVNFSASSGILKFTTGTASLVTAPSGDIVGTSDSQTLTNKTLTSPTINTGIIGSAGITFNGSTGTTKIIANSTAGNNTITLSNNNGTIVTTGDNGTITSNMIANNTIVNADINTSAAIAITKLAASTISGVSLGNNLNSLSTSSGGGLTISSTSYNGSAAGTISVDTSVVATLSSTQTLQNKTLNSPVIDSIFDLLSCNLTTSATTADQILHSISASTYRSVKYFMQVTSGGSYHVVEIVLVHDGTSVIISEYGRIMTSGSLSTFDADISSGNLRLKVTPANAITVYKAAATAIRT